MPCVSDRPIPFFIVFLDVPACRISPGVVSFFHCHPLVRHRQAHHESQRLGDSFYHGDLGVHPGYPGSAPGARSYDRYSTLFVSSGTPGHSDSSPVAGIFQRGRLKARPCRSCKKARKPCLVPAFVLVRDTRSILPLRDVWRRTNCVRCGGKVCPASAAATRKIFATTLGTQPTADEAARTAPGIDVIIKQACEQQQMHDHGRASGGADDPVSLMSPPTHKVAQLAGLSGAGVDGRAPITLSSSPAPQDPAAQDRAAREQQRARTPPQTAEKHGSGTPLSQRMGSWTRRLTKRARSEDRSSSPSRISLSTSQTTTPLPPTRSGTALGLRDLSRPESSVSLRSAASFARKLDFTTSETVPSAATLSFDSLPERSSGPGGSLHGKPFKQRASLGDVFGTSVVLGPSRDNTFSTRGPGGNRLRTEMNILKKDRLSTKREEDEAGSLSSLEREIEPSRCGRGELSSDDLMFGRSKHSEVAQSEMRRMSLSNEGPHDPRDVDMGGGSPACEEAEMREEFSLPTDDDPITSTSHTVPWRPFVYNGNALPLEARTFWPEDFADLWNFSGDSEASYYSSDLSRSIKESQDFFTQYWQRLCDVRWRVDFGSEEVRAEMRGEASQQAEAMKEWFADVSRESVAGMTSKYEQVHLVRA